MNYSQALKKLKESGRCSCPNCVIIELSREDGVKKEVKFWKDLSKNLPLSFMRRVESTFDPGWPDVHYSHEGNMGWLELKAEHKFPNQIDFQPAQPLWLTKYWASGGNCYILLKVIDENKVYVWAGKDAMKLDAKGGTHAVEPMLEINCSARGWKELYDMFGLLTPRYPTRNLRIV